eukprot:g61507.t1
MALQAALEAFRVGQHDVLTKFVANYEGKSLDLSSKNLGYVGASAVAKGLLVNKMLQTLWLSNNNIGADGAKEIAAALKVNQTLTSLYLWDNKIGDEGAAHIAAAVKDNKSVIELRMGGNDIGPAGAKAIANMLKVNKTLVEFDIRGNKIGPAGAAAIANMLKVNKTLTSLDLENNAIGDAGAQAMGEALRVNSSIRSIDLRANNIGIEGAKAIGLALQVNPILKQLFGVELKDHIQGLPQGVSNNEKILEYLRQSKIKQVPVSSAVPEKEGKKNQEPQPQSKAKSPNTTKVAAPQEKKKQVISVLEAKVLKDGGAPFLNGRVMIAGRAEAGKTALARAFRGDPYLSDTGSTVGMDRPADVQVSRLATQTSAADAAVSWRVLTEKETKLSEGQRQLAAAVAAAKGSQGEGAADNLSSAHASLSQLQQERMHRKKQRPLGPEVPSTPTVRQCGSTSTSEVLKPTASLGGNQQSGMQPLDKELVLRIEKGELRGDELTLSVWDLGGQEVFRSLLQLFLKRGAAYLVLFDMRQLVPSASEQDRRDCLDSLRFWMRSLEVHARDEALENPAPPVFLVGTHKDSKQLQLHEYRNHRAIEELLDKELGAFASYISRHDCKKTKDGRPLAFYPIDSTARNPVDPTIQALMADLDTAMRAEDFMKRMMPHSWIRLFDELHVRTQFTLTLQQALQIGAHCGLDEQETMSALFYMDDQGRVLHNQDDDHLRQLVVLDPSRFLVEPVTTLICEFRIHANKAHRQAQIKFPQLWRKLTQGRLDSQLLPYLWPQDKFTDQQRDHLLQLMTKFGLAVATGSASSANTSSVISSNAPGERSNSAQFLLLPLLPKTDRNAQRPSAHSVSLVLCFCTRRQTEASLTVELSKTAIKENGFLPTGYFGRLVGKCIQRAIGRKEQPLVWTQEEFPVFKDCARLSLCGMDVQLELREELNVVQVWSSAGHFKQLEALQELLLCFCTEVSREAYGSNIQAVSYLPFGQAEASASGQGWPLVQLQALRKAVQTQQPLKVEGTSRNEAELRRDFDRSPPCWLPPLNEPGHWDFFLSHTQRGHAGKELVEVLSQGFLRRGLTSWLDVKMKDMSRPAMEEGVCRSRCVIAVLTDEGKEGEAYLDRQYCLDELRWAVAARVPVVMVVGTNDKGRIGDTLSKMPADLKEVLQGNVPDVDRSHAKKLEVSIDIILQQTPFGSSHAPVSYATQQAEAKKAEEEAKKVVAAAQTASTTFEMATQAGRTETLKSLTDRIKKELGLDASLNITEAIREAQTQLGMDVSGTLMDQAKALLAAIGC